MTKEGGGEERTRIDDGGEDELKQDGPVVPWRTIQGLIGLSLWQGHLNSIIASPPPPPTPQQSRGTGAPSCTNSHGNKNEIV